jgi:hypothetical protein
MNHPPAHADDPYPPVTIASHAGPLYDAIGQAVMRADMAQRWTTEQRRYYQIERWNDVSECLLLVLSAGDRRLQILIGGAQVKSWFRWPDDGDDVSAHLMCHKAIMGETTQGVPAPALNDRGVAHVVLLVRHLASLLAGDAA